jgi:hypothetical protein
LEPIRPDSSADHQKNSTVLRGFTFAIWIAVSRIAAEPEPLSLIPGPALTESRCAPTVILFASPLSPGSVALMLRVISGRDDVSVLIWTTTGPLAICATSDWPSVSVVPIAGIADNPVSPSVPLSTPATLL